MFHTVLSFEKNIGNFFSEYFFRPIADFRFFGIHEETGALFPVSFYGRFFEKGAAFSEAGGMCGSERNHGFAFEIILFNEGRERPGGNPPPNRVADENRRIAVPIFRCLFRKKESDNAAGGRDKGITGMGQRKGQ